MFEFPTCARELRPIHLFAVCWRACAYRLPHLREVMPTLGNVLLRASSICVRVWLSVWSSVRVVSGSGNLRSENTRHERELPCHIRDYYEPTAFPCLSGDMYPYPWYYLLTTTVCIVHISDLCVLLSTFIHIKHEKLSTILT